MDKTKTNVNLYLCGGGVKCSYQATFLKELNKSHEINNIISLSFGSLIGYSISLGYYDEIIEFCKTLTPDALVPCFKYYNNLNQLSVYCSKIPIIGLYVSKFINMIIKIIWIGFAMKKKGFYVPTFGEHYLDKIIINKKNNLNKLSKFWCVVYNVTKNKIELVNGTHPLIEKYIVASCSLWVIFPPVKVQRLTSECDCDDNCDCDKTNVYCNCTIENHKYNEYVDPGFILTIPYIDVNIHDNHSDNNHNNQIDMIFTSFDINNPNKTIARNTGNNMIEYLNNLIGIASNMSQSNIINRWEIKNETYVINYDPPVTNPTDINTHVIKKIMNDGNTLYDLFKKIENSNNKIKHHNKIIIQL